MRVLSVRTPDGHYLEFTSIRARMNDGAEVVIDLDEAVFVQLLDIDQVEPPVSSAPVARRNGKPSTLTINGAGGIESQENVKGMG